MRTVPNANPTDRSSIFGPMDVFEKILPRYIIQRTTFTYQMHHRERKIISRMEINVRPAVFSKNILDSKLVDAKVCA